MQGSNTSRIGMARQRQSWDDSSWGGGNKTNAKVRDAKKEREREMRRQARQQREDSSDNL